MHPSTPLSIGRFAGGFETIVVPNLFDQQVDKLSQLSKNRIGGGYVAVMLGKARCKEQRRF